MLLGLIASICIIVSISVMLMSIKWIIEDNLSLMDDYVKNKDEVL